VSSDGGAAMTAALQGSVLVLAMFSPLNPNDRPLAEPRSFG
jgi:hypothetical protein